jgi:hypothetical protein
VDISFLTTLHLFRWVSISLHVPISILMYQYLPSRTAGYPGYSLFNHNGHSELQWISPSSQPCICSGWYPYPIACSCQHAYFSSSATKTRRISRIFNHSGRNKLTLLLALVLFRLVALFYSTSASQPYSLSNKQNIHYPIQDLAKFLCLLQKYGNN